MSVVLVDQYGEKLPWFDRKEWPGGPTTTMRHGVHHQLVKAFKVAYHLQGRDKNNPVGSTRDGKNC